MWRNYKKDWSASYEAVNWKIQGVLKAYGIPWSASYEAVNWKNYIDLDKEDL